MFCASETKMKIGKPLRLLVNLGASALAFLWRRMMFSTKFVAITGSYGKTTATECLGTILEVHFQTKWVKGGRNDRRGLATRVLGTKPWHKFTVIEVGTKLPGALWRASWMIDPDLAVVLAVGRMHTNYFADMDAIAAEKSQLLRRIQGSRIAILNGDDAYVKAMAGKCGGRVMTFGTSPENDLWADKVSSLWPARLSFRAHLGASSCVVHTNLIGEHWLSAVLGSLLAAHACGIRLEDAASALERAQPVMGRMQPVTIARGITFLRDEFNESLSTMDAALSVLANSSAPRRLVVLGDVYDGPQKQRERLDELGRRAARSADFAVFLGNKMRYAARAAVEAGMQQQNARAFGDLQEGADFLKSELRAGDLVLLRGYSQWHMERLYFAQIGTIRCWLRRCARVPSCDDCTRLGLETHDESPADEEGLSKGVSSVAEVNKYSDRLV